MFYRIGPIRSSLFLKENAVLFGCLGDRPQVAGQTQDAPAKFRKIILQDQGSILLRVDGDHHYLHFSGPAAQLVEHTFEDGRGGRAFVRASGVAEI
jgi:hypothetical protein